MSTRYTELQLDALRELANIASGNAATALSQMLAREIELSVPRALSLPLGEACEAVGTADEHVTGVVLPVNGQLEALVLLLFGERDAATLCSLLGVEPATEIGDSALGEIGNILGASYINALATMTGLDMQPGPPQLASDMLGAIVASVLAGTAQESDSALLMDSEMDVAGAPCSLTFLMLPTSGSAHQLLVPLGLGDDV